MKVPRRRDKLRAISTIDGTINVAQATPRIRPVTNRESCVFSQMPKTVSDQSIVIGMSERNSQTRGSGSMVSIERHKGYAANPRKIPK